MRYVIAFFIITLLFACNEGKVSSDERVLTDKSKETIFALKSIRLSSDEANRLAQLPLDCITQPLPYKPGNTISKAEDLGMPQEHHPAFYGCFDWHSAVHGHWSLVYLLKEFPDMAKSEEIIQSG